MHYMDLTTSTFTVESRGQETYQRTISLRNYETWNLSLTTHEKEITRVNLDLFEMMALRKFPTRS